MKDQSLKMHKIAIFLIKMETNMIMVELVQMESH